MKKHALSILRNVMIVCLLSGCSTPKAAMRCPVGSADFALANGEIQLESALHQISLLEAKTYSFKNAAGDPVSVCSNKNRDVLDRKLAFKLLLGKAQGDDRAMERTFNALLREGTPSTLLPVVHLWRHYHEGLLKCVLEASEGKSPSVPMESHVSILTEENFEAETSHGVILIHFTAHWCGPCIRMAPDLEKMARDYKGKLRIGVLDVDRNIALFERFELKSLPTLILLVNGKEQKRSDERFEDYAGLQKWTQEALEKVAGE